MTTDIKFEEVGRGGRFFIPGDRPNDQAELTFVGTDDVWVANHTYVPENQRGQGIAAKLVDRLVAAARDEGVKINPSCPYVKAKFDQHPDWSDLLAQT